MNDVMSCRCNEYFIKVVKSRVSNIFDASVIVLSLYICLQKAYDGKQSKIKSANKFIVFVYIARGELIYIFLQERVYTYLSTIL